MGATVVLTSQAWRDLSEIIDYPGGAHGLTDTAKDQLDADLLAFLIT